MTNVTDVVVVGAGHAGCEAALAAARMGCAVALVTLKRDSVARMSCNPAIGGLAKGHLVREIDALGGAMGRLADQCGIQFRLFNRSRGPAVRGPRAQQDKDRYHHAMLAEITACPNLTLVEGEVAELTVDIGPRFRRAPVRRAGVARTGRGDDDRDLPARTASCRLRADARWTRGRRTVELPCRPRSSSLGFRMGRFKTGTPPRLLRTSVDLARFERQPGDPEPTFFSETTERVDAATSYLPYRVHERPCSSARHR